MSIRCWLEIHNWFYYDEFDAFDSARRICRRCGRIDSTFLNPKYFNYDVYEIREYATNHEKQRILDKNKQIEKYRTELNKQLKQKTKRIRLENRSREKNIPIPSSSAELNHLENNLIIKIKNKIKELEK